MVGLHMVDDEVVDRTSLEDLVELMEEDIRVADIDCIDEGRLFVNDEVGIVRHARGNFPEVLEAFLHAVIDADVVDGVRDLWYLVHSP